MNLTIPVILLLAAVAFSPALSLARTADLMIAGGTVVTMDPEQKILDPGWIIIKNGKIIEVSDRPPDTEHWKIKTVLPAQNYLVMPGLVNTHTHAAMTLFRGFADDLPLEDWLQNHIWPAEAKYINPRSVYLGAQLAIIEMVKSGTTAFNDMYFFADEVARAAWEIGIRAVVSEGILDYPTPNSKTPEEAIAYTRHLMRKWQGNPLVTIAVACHATYSCSPKLLKQTKALANYHDTLFHIHVAETIAEIDIIRDLSQLTAVQYLDSLKVLDDKTVAAHSIHLTPQDIQVMATRKTGISHNPSSNMKLASGVAPVVDLLRAGATMSLGTDGAASNNDLNLFEEMDLATKLQKITQKDPAAINAQTVVQMATLGGAKVLGLQNKIGSIEKAKFADIILINLNQPHVTPIHHIYSHLVYAIKGADVETVIIQGKIIMHDRQLQTIDENIVMQEVRQLVQSTMAP